MAQLAINTQIRLTKTAQLNQILTELKTVFHLLDETEIVKLAVSEFYNQYIQNSQNKQNKSSQILNIDKTLSKSIKSGKSKLLKTPEDIHNFIYN